MSDPFSHDGPRPDAVRGGHYVSDRITWSAVHRTTRLRATTVTFGWRGKLLLSAPPIAVLAIWAAGGALTPRGVTGAIAVGFGLPLIWATIWWLRQVWVAGPDESARTTTQRTLDHTAPMLPEPDVTTAHPNLAFLYQQPPSHEADDARR